MSCRPDQLAGAIGADLVEPGANAAILDAFTCDLLSEVIAHAPDGGLLITVLSHVNTVAVAVAAGLNAILVCQGRDIPPETRAAARREGVALLSTPMNAFRASVVVHRALEITP